MILFLLLVFIRQLLIFFWS